MPPRPPADTSGRFPRPGEAPHPHQTGQGPLPRRGPFPPLQQPTQPRRNLLTGCLAIAVITLVLLALLIAALVWMSRDSSVGQSAQIEHGEPAVTVLDAPQRPLLLRREQRAARHA